MAFDVEAIVEIPFGSWYKYEVDKQTGQLIIDRPLPAELPYNYGYIPHTLHGDGDPLDVCILGKYPIYPLTKVKLKVLGAFICNDNGDSDDKVIAKFVRSDIPEAAEKELIEEVRQYLSTYKPGFVVERFVGVEEAQEILMKDLVAYQEDAEGKAY